MKRLVSILAVVAWSASAATFGVPTNLDAVGATTSSSVNPPGWLEIFGTAADSALGDVVHQHSFFIEVTGNALDVRIFDPGASGARDFTGNSATTFTYTLRRVGSNPIATVAMGNDSTSGTITDNRLVRMAASSFVALNTGSAFATTPGLYELRVTTSGGNEGNFYGFDVRAGTGAAAAHYTVYAAPDTDTPAGFLVGGNTNAGTPAGAMTPPATAFVNVNRGCTFDLNNFDGDGTSSASITPVDGSPTAGVTLSGNDLGVTQTATIETTTAQNHLINNYGLWQLSFDPGTTNAIDWAFADFAGWSNSTTTAPRNPTAPLRVYLPNGYSPVAGNANAVPPGVPSIALGAAVVSGPNPFVQNQTTRLVVTIAVRNGTGSALSNVRMNVGGIPFPTGNSPVTSAATAIQCLINGVVGTCGSPTNGTQGNGSSRTQYVRGTIASLAAGSTASLRFEIDYTPRATGMQPLSGLPATGTSNATLNNTSWADFDTPWLADEKLGPICRLTSQIGGTTEALTPARISGIWADERKVTFDTAVQLGTVGFRVFTSNDEKGRERHALHDGVIASTAPDTFEPQRYLVPTTRLVDDWLFIEEVQAKGAPTIIARTRVSELTATPPPLAAFTATKLVKADASELRLYKTQPTTGAATALKLFFSKPGRANVTLNELEANGFPRGGRPELFHLGQPVPFTWDARGESISFRVEPFASQYTGDAVYVVTSNGVQAPAPTITFTRREAPPVHRRVEHNAIYFALTPWAESPWFWSLVRSNATWPTAPAQGLFDLQDISRVAGTTAVRIKLLGRSGHHHQVEARINGVSIGTVDFDGATSATLEGSIAVQHLRETSNALSLTLTSTAVSSADIGAIGFAYLDWLEVDGLPPVTPLETFVDRMEPYDATLPNVRGADYLIVTHGEFLDEARELAELKRQEGLRPVVIDAARAYDAFSSGTFDAAAIKALISDTAARSPNLRYVLLVGDDTVDPRDFMGLHGRAFIPSLDGWDGELGRVPSESRYVDLDDDGLPDLAIGRLPVQSKGDALTLLDKLGHYPMRARTKPQHIVFIDARGPNDDDFLARATAMSQSMGATPRIIDSAAGVAAAKQALSQTLSTGDAATLHYIGHGAPNAWTSRGLWNVADSQAAQRAPSDTVGFQWSCFSQWYQYLFGPSLGESLLLMPQGGVTASFGPSGITRPSHQAELSEAVYRNVYQQQLPLGDAILEAKRALTPGPASAALIDGWNLLGDPAMIPSPLATGRSPWTPYEDPNEPTAGALNKKAVQAAPSRRVDVAR